MRAQGLVDAFNSVVRGIVTIFFAGGFVYVFVRAAPAISADAFIGMLGTVLGFWFGARTAEKMGLSAPSPPPGGTTTQTVSAPATKEIP